MTVVLAENVEFAIFHDPVPDPPRYVVSRQLENPWRVRPHISQYDQCPTPRQSGIVGLLGHSRHHAIHERRILRQSRPNLIQRRDPCVARRSGRREVVVQPQSLSVRRISLSVRDVLLGPIVDGRDTTVEYCESESVIAQRFVGCERVEAGEVMVVHEGPDHCGVLGISGG